MCQQEPKNHHGGNPLIFATKSPKEEEHLQEHN
jgi:hypothetical protein